MTHEKFDQPLLIREGKSTRVDLSKTQFFCNIDGRPSYAARPPKGVTQIKPAKRSCKMPDVRQYTVGDVTATGFDPQYGESMRMEFITDELVYTPLLATRDTAAAFGMTLVEKGQAIRVDCQPEHLGYMQQVDFEYGMFAGHWSPYHETKGRCTMGTVGTDLECHDFPHVFASVDEHLPLVISVGRYEPKAGKIHLADLWVPCGSALYVPPGVPSNDHPYLYLHGNRNSALGCWRGIQHTSVHTQTLLRTEGAFFHWYWNDLPSTHPLLK